jgi:hypothetical protein
MTEYPLWINRTNLTPAFVNTAEKNETSVSMSQRIGMKPDRYWIPAVTLRCRFQPGER